MGSPLTIHGVIDFNGKGHDYFPAKIRMPTVRTRLIPSPVQIANHVLPLGFARKFYKRAWDEQVAPRYRSGEPAPGMSRERFLRLLDAAEYLAAHIHEAPVWIVPCLEGGTPTRTSGSSIYPAVQNMLLAARALGLGATLTTLYVQFEKEAEAALGLPPGVHSYALLPIGYPIGRFGPVRRVPLAGVVYEDRWGQTCRDL
jgi:nitroreductase